MAVSENQYVELAMGNGIHIRIFDHTAVGVIQHPSPVERAVWVARLRAIADLIEAS